MNVPKLRFKEFDGEWEENTFRDITKLSQGLQIAISNRFLEGGDNREFYITNEFLNPKSQKKYYIENPPKNVIANEEDILMTRTGNTGKVVTNVRGAFHNNFFKVAYDSNNIYKLFLYYLLNSKPIQKEILVRAGTSTIPDLNHNDFYRIKINLPNKEEQKKIGNFFEILNKKIQLQQQKIDLLQEQKYSFLNRLFPKKVSAEPLLRNPKFDGEWSKVKLAEVVDHVKSYSLSRDVEKIEDTGMKYVHYGDIHTKVANIIVANSNLPNIELGDYITLEKGDLILADASEDYKGIAEPAILTIQPDYKLVAGLHTIALRPIDIDSFFLYYLFKSSAFKEYGYRIGTGMKVFGITANNVLNFEFMLPSIEEQRFIGNFLKSLDDKIDLQIRKLAVLKNQKQGFMQQMFI
ncbi:restriction endonuclease subunit S [Kurthia gibsonii]|uniref:restriction endonuclease subunit S n=1 Tax=Kurthia gibsonii TaxID=33946 RepID=UPI0034D020DA